MEIFLLILVLMYLHVVFKSPIGEWNNRILWKMQEHKRLWRIYKGCVNALCPKRTCVITTHDCAVIDYTVEVEKAQQEIKMWHRFHPWGATTSEEKDELLRLNYMYIGLIVARSGDLKIPFSFEILKQLEDPEDWQHN